MTGDILAVYAAVVATFLAFLRWRDYRREREPILEIVPSPPMAAGAYKLTLHVRNPSIHTMALESVRLTSPKGGSVACLRGDVSLRSEQDLGPLEARPASPEIDANSEERFELAVILLGSPKLPLKVKLKASLLLEARTRRPKYKTAKLAAVIQPRRGE